MGGADILHRARMTGSLARGAPMINSIFSRARLKAVNNVGGHRLDGADLVAAPQRWTVLDYKNLEGTDVEGAMRWVMDRATSAHGVCTWFDCETSAGIGYFQLACCQRAAHLQATVLFLAGSRRIDGGRTRWNFACAPTHRLRTTYGRGKRGVLSGERVQAAVSAVIFAGAPLSPERFRKACTKLVPEPNDECRIDSVGLDLMNQKRGVPILEAHWKFHEKRLRESPANESF